MANLALPFSPSATTVTTRILRERLSVTDARDIADDFGDRVGQGFNWYESVSNGGLDTRVAAIVQWVAEHPEHTVLFFAVLFDWRPDLRRAFEQASF